MGDPGFPRSAGGGECQPLNLGQKPIIWQNFAKTVWEWKEFDWEGVCDPAPPGSDNGDVFLLLTLKIMFQKHSKREGISIKMAWVFFFF